MRTFLIPLSLIVAIPWITASIAHAQSQVEAIREAVVQGDLTKAGELLRHWLTQAPEDPLGRLWQARLSLWRGDASAALRILQELHGRYPKDADILLVLAQTQTALGDPSGALVTLQYLHHIAPDYLDAWRLHLRLLAQLQRERDYRALLYRLRRNYPKAGWMEIDPVEVMTVDVDHQWLDQGLSPWLRWQVSYGRSALTLPTTVRFEFAHERRFDLWDSQWGITLTARQRQWDWYLSSRFSPKHQVLPRTELGVGLGKVLSPSLRLAVDILHRNYRTSTVDSLSLESGLHRQGYGVTYRFTTSRLMVGEWSNAQRIGVHRAFTPRWSLQADLWTGRELEYAPGLGVLESNVRGGGIRLTHHQGEYRIDLSALWHRQGIRYTRRGAHLALRRRF